MCLRVYYFAQAIGESDPDEEERYSLVCAVLRTAALSITVHDVAVECLYAKDKIEFTQMLWDFYAHSTVGHPAASAVAIITTSSIDSNNMLAATQAIPVVSMLPAETRLIRTYPYFTTMYPNLDFAVLNRLMREFNWRVLYIVTSGEISGDLVSDLQAWNAQPSNCLSWSETGTCVTYPLVVSAVLRVSGLLQNVDSSLEEAQASGSRLFFLATDTQAVYDKILQSAHRVGVWQKTAWITNQQVLWAYDPSGSDVDLYTGMLMIAPHTEVGIRSDTVAKYIGVTATDEFRLENWAVMLQATDTIEVFGAALDSLLDYGARSQDLLQPSLLLEAIRAVNMPGIAGRIKFGNSSEVGANIQSRQKRETVWAIYNVRPSTVQPSMLEFVNVSTKISTLDGVATGEIDGEAIIWYFRQTVFCCLRSCC